VLPHLAALAGATLRLWRLGGSGWQLVAGPHADAPRAPRAPGQTTAAFVAIPENGDLYLELVPTDAPITDETSTRLLAVITSVLNAEVAMSTMSGELAAKYEEIDLLYSIGELLGHAHAVEEVAGRIVREVADVVGARRAGLRIFDPDAGLLRLVGVVGDDDQSIPDAVPISAPDEVVVARAFRTRRVETGVQPQWVGGEVLAVPIVYAASGQPARVVGTLALAERAGGGSFTRDETKLLAAVATQIGAALENARLVQKDRARQRMARELELAHDLQIKLMPTPAVLKGEAEVAVHSNPAESLGGDFYTFSRLGRGRIGVMLGDVSSHGFSAALIAAQVMAAAGIHASATAVPDETLGLLHDSLRGELESTEMYLSLFYGVFDPMAGRLSFSNAGHPYAFRVPRFGPAIRLATTAPPLGLAPTGEFGKVVMPWDFARDLLVLCTDGLTDAANELGERYGAERLMDRLGEWRGLAPQQLLTSILEDLTAFGAAATDDITILIVRV
jgi:sigma-B regulation protein RsbU (phosphoserine phosphatase)